MPADSCRDTSKVLQQISYGKDIQCQRYSLTIDQKHQISSPKQEAGSPLYRPIQSAGPSQKTSVQARYSEVLETSPSGFPCLIAGAIP